MKPASPNPVARGPTHHPSLRSVAPNPPAAAGLVVGACAIVSPIGHAVRRGDGSPRLSGNSARIVVGVDRPGGALASTLRGVGSEVQPPSGSADAPFDPLRTTVSRKKSDALTNQAQGHRG